MHAYHTCTLSIQNNFRRWLLNYIDITIKIYIDRSCLIIIYVQVWAGQLVYDSWNGCTCVIPHMDRCTRWIQNSRDVDDRLVDMRFFKLKLHRLMETCMHAWCTGSHFKVRTTYIYIYIINFGSFQAHKHSCLTPAHTTDQTWPGCPWITGQGKVWPWHRSKPCCWNRGGVRRKCWGLGICGFPALISKWCFFNLDMHCFNSSRLHALDFLAQSATEEQSQRVRIPN